MKNASEEYLILVHRSDRAKEPTVGPVAAKISASQKSKMECGWQLTSTNRGTERTPKRRRRERRGSE